jgi:hypothetical protein
MHVNSIIAYYEHRFQFTKREMEILGCIFMSSRPWTDREIKDALRYADMNSVRPRISELVEKGCLEECASKICPITKKRVRLVRIRENNDKQMSLAI